MDHLEIHLHPMVVHFPVALFISAFLLEVLSRVFKSENLHRSAFVLYIIASLISPLAVWTGWREAEEWHLVKHPVLNTHKNFALLTMGTALISLPILWVIRKKSGQLFRKAFLVILLVIVGVVSTAAYNGGRLVYEYGIGVEKE